MNLKGYLTQKGIEVNKSFQGTGGVFLFGVRPFSIYSTSSKVIYLFSAGVSDTKIHQSKTHIKQADP